MICRADVTFVLRFLGNLGTVRWHLFKVALIQIQWTHLTPRAGRRPKHRAPSAFIFFYMVVGASAASLINAAGRGVRMHNERHVTSVPIAPRTYVVFCFPPILFDRIRIRLLTEHPTMSLPWNYPLDPPRSPTTSRRTKETWMLRGFALMTFLNLILVFKWYHAGAETKTPLDDFQMLCVVICLALSPRSKVHRRRPCSDRMSLATGNHNLPHGRLRRIHRIPTRGQLCLLSTTTCSPYLLQRLGIRSKMSAPPPAVSSFTRDTSPRARSVSCAQQDGSFSRSSVSRHPMTARESGTASSISTPSCTSGPSTAASTSIA